MFGGNFSDNWSLYCQNYGTSGGSMYVVQIAYVKIFNSVFLNQSALTG